MRPRTLSSKLSRAPVPAPHPRINANTSPACRPTSSFGAPSTTLTLVAASPRLLLHGAESHAVPQTLLRPRGVGALITSLRMIRRFVPLDGALAEPQTNGGIRKHASTSADLRMEMIDGWVDG